MMQLRESIITALIQKFEGKISTHKVNIEVMLENTVGVGKHSNITKTIEGELQKIADVYGKLMVLEKYFINKSSDTSTIKKELLND